MPIDTNVAQPAAQSIEQLAVNTIRTLSMDAVQAANSGHPGTPMALAPVAYQLWQHHLRFDPELPVWANRDRFVLSDGHASALLYSMLHLTGVRAVNPKYEGGIRLWEATISECIDPSAARPPVRALGRRPIAH